MKTARKRSQKGGGLLMFVLIISMVILSILVTYLLLASRITKVAYDSTRSMESLYADLGVSKVTILSKLDGNPDNDWVPEWIKDSFELEDDRQVVERFVETGANGTRYTIQTQTLTSPRTVEIEVVDPTIADRSVDIVLMIDNSESMDWENPNYALVRPGSAMDTARTAAVQFIDRFMAAPASRFGVFAYATEANSVTGVSEFVGPAEYAHLKALVGDIHPPTAPSPPYLGETDIGGALLNAHLLLNGSPAPSPDTKRYVIFLTDGVPTVDATNFTCRTWYEVNHDDPRLDGCVKSGRQFARDQAAAIKADGVLIVMIGLGPNVEVPLMEDLASSDPYTGGKMYFQINDTSSIADLSDAYFEIEKVIVGKGRVSLDEVKPREL